MAFQSSEAPYACKGTYRIRTADEDIIMTAAQIEAAMAVRIEAKDPWDGRMPGRPISDVDEETLRAYVKRGNAKGRIPFEFTAAEDVLSRLGLLRDDGLTNATDALFCPSKVIRLKMGILATHSRTEIFNLHQEEGTVFDLVNKAAAYILNNTRRRFVIIDSGPRDEIPELPTKAVKEALMNAFAHRDWTSVGSVQIDIFNDAAEILSPQLIHRGAGPRRTPCGYKHFLENPQRAHHESVLPLERHRVIRHGHSPHQSSQGRPVGLQPVPNGRYVLRTTTSNGEARILKMQANHTRRYSQRRRESSSTDSTICVAPFATNSSRRP